ncbi:response regulator [Azospirillum sp. sgz302134]
MANETVTVFLIDANRLFRDCLKRLFEGTAFSIVGETSRVAEGASAVNALDIAPHLVLIDLTNVGAGDIEALRRLREQASQCRLVILDSNLSGRRLWDALRAGVDGYLLKSIAPEALTESSGRFREGG